MQDLSDQQDQQLFKEHRHSEIIKINNKNEVIDNEFSKQFSLKRLRKQQKDTKNKKKRHLDNYDDKKRGLENGIRSVIEEEASEDSEEGQEINTISGTRIPSRNDFPIFIVDCKKGKEQEIVMAILNKRSHIEQTRNEKINIKIGSAMALRKRYGGKIFAQAQNEKAIGQFLQDLLDIRTGNITALDADSYESLFETKRVKEIKLIEQQYVRITKGVYGGDLGRIVKLKKHAADIAVVPRIDFQKILGQMKEEQAKNLERETTWHNKNQILKKYTNPKTYPSAQIPPKKLVDARDFYPFLYLPANKKYLLTTSGLMVFRFSYKQIAKIQGTILPIELQPFVSEGNTENQQEMNNVVSTNKFAIGDQVQIVAGQLIGCYGFITEVTQHTATLQCKNREIFGKSVEEIIDYMQKRSEASLDQGRNPQSGLDTRMRPESAKKFGCFTIQLEKSQEF